MQICKDSHSDIYTALLHYHTTPKGDLPSPSQLLMSRILRTKTPGVQLKYKPTVIDSKIYENKIKGNVKKVSDNYNKNAKNLERVENGENIMFKKCPSSFWIPGVVTDQRPEPRCLIVMDEDGNFYRRNREHILKKPTIKEENEI